MNVRIFENAVETLRPIAEAWQKEAEVNDMGILVDNIDKYLAELHLMAYSNNSDLIVLYDGDIPIGFIGLRYFESPLGNQLIANEHYLYVMPDKRGMGSMRLIKNAKMMAKLRGCSHLVMNASNLASDMHEKVCSFYRKIKMKHFETSFICELKE